MSPSSDVPRKDQFLGGYKFFRAKTGEFLSIPVRRPLASPKETIQFCPEPLELRSKLHIEYRVHTMVELKACSKPHGTINAAATSLPIDLHRHDCKMLSSKCLRKQYTAMTKALLGTASRLAVWPNH
jgi:hypothetical protein